MNHTLLSKKDGETQREAEFTARSSQGADLGSVLPSTMLDDLTSSACTDVELVHGHGHGGAGTDKIRKREGPQRTQTLSLPTHALVASPIWRAVEVSNAKSIG